MAIFDVEIACTAHFVIYVDTKGMLEMFIRHYFDIQWKMHGKKQSDLWKSITKVWVRKPFVLFDCSIFYAFDLVFSTFMEFQITLKQHQLLLIRWKKSEECIFFLISLPSPNCVNSKLKLNQARFPTDGVNR